MTDWGGLTCSEREAYSLGPIQIPDAQNATFQPLGADGTAYAVHDPNSGGSVDNVQ